MIGKIESKFPVILLMAFFLLSNFGFVVAQTTTIGDIGNKVGAWIKDAFGYTDITARADWRFVVVMVVIFFMLFFAFYDIIYSFTGFTKTTSYILGFGLAVIAALTKGVLAISRFFFSITAAFGAVSVAIIIIIAFIISIILHIGPLRKIREIKEKKEFEGRIKRMKGGGKLLEEMGQ